MKIVTVVGARPQFVKAAALSRAVASTPGVAEIIVHTGQHYDANMSDVFFADLGLPAPNYRLSTGGGSHGQMTGRQLAEVEALLMSERPDVCLVYGDTNSTLAGALAAAKLGTPVAHVEAGLRSFNRRMPEEINRVVTDHVSDVLFAPTAAAMGNLAAEGIPPDRCVLAGDVMLDVALMVHATVEPDAVLRRMGLEGGPFILSTIHRQHATDDPATLVEIFAALFELSAEMPVVLPLHPRTRKAAAADARCAPLLSRLRTLEPVGFLDMTALTLRAARVVTDSGGLQKEAFFAGVPAVTVRSETEWTELVEAGWSALPETLSRGHIIAAARRMLARPRTAPDTSAYGSGDAARTILGELRRRYGGGP